VREALSIYRSNYMDQERHGSCMKSMDYEKLDWGLDISTLYALTTSPRYLWYKETMRSSLI
jgi:hypothetical protein